jgi:hypothetical protein
MTGKMISRRVKSHRRPKPGAPDKSAPIVVFRVSKHAKAKQKPKPK